MADDGSSGFDGAKLITGGLALVSGVAGLVGTFTGVLPRLLRNDRGNFNLVICFVLVAIGLSFIASEFKSTSKQGVHTEGSDSNTTVTTTTSDTTETSTKVARIGLSAASLFFFGWAGFVLLSGITTTFKSGDQPRLSASWNFAAAGQPVVTVRMQLDDLAANQTVYINAYPLGSTPDNTVYRSQTGADADGTADESFDIPLPKGASGLQIVASIDAAKDCQGANIPAIVAATDSSANKANAPVVSSAAMAAVSGPAGSGTAIPLPPVSNNHALTFSCIQLASPIPPSTAPSSGAVGSPSPAPTSSSVTSGPTSSKRGG